MEPIALRIKWLGKGAKVVELPIPFIQKCEKTGEVVCNPIGEFDVENGTRLLAVPGIEGVFELVEKVYPEGAEAAKSADVSLETIAPKAVSPIEYYDYTCHCGCGGKLEKKANHRYTGMPKYLLGHAGFKKKQKTVAAPSPAA